MNALKRCLDCISHILPRDECYYSNRCLRDSAPASPWRESKEATHRRFYEAFHDWFKNDGGCDFWSECDAPEALATIAVELHDKMIAPPSTSDGGEPK